jgi:hypothetical protein
MSSVADICNLALSHIGVGKEVANIVTERTEEARALNRFYEQARDATLRDFSWPFAIKVMTLNLVEEKPYDEWLFSYRYPTDCVKIIKVLSGIRRDTRQSASPYKIGRDNVGLLVYSDVDDAKIEFVSRVENTALFPPDFIMALSFRLAAYVAPRLTQGDPFKLRNQALELYSYELERARASALNEQQAEEDPDSEFIRTRF